MNILTKFSKHQEIKALLKKEQKLDTHELTYLRMTMMLIQTTSLRPLKIKLKNRYYKKRHQVRPVPFPKAKRKLFEKKNNSFLKKSRNRHCRYRNCQLRQRGK